MIIPEIELKEEDPVKIQNNKKNKTLKKIDVEVFESNLINLESDTLKNHLIVIKKKRHRESDLSNSSENKSLLNNIFFKRKKSEENNSINFKKPFANNPIKSNSAEFSNTDFKTKMNDYNMNNKTKIEQTDKYDFSLTSLKNGNEAKEREAGAYNGNNLNSNLLFNANGAFSNLTSFALNNPNANILDLAKEIEQLNLNNNYNNPSEDKNSKNFLLKNTLSKITRECEAFKNYFPITLTSEISRSLAKKEDLEILAQEQQKFCELKKINVLQKRNLLTNKTFTLSQFRHLQYKYKNIFGSEKFAKSTKLLSSSNNNSIKDTQNQNQERDEIMVIHAEDLLSSEANKASFQKLLHEIKNEKASLFDLNLYQISQLPAESKFSLSSISDDLLLKKINECEAENQLFYEKENANKDDSDLEAKMKEYDNDSNREDNPNNDYPEESSDENSRGKANKCESSGEDDEEFFAGVYNQKHYGTGFSYGKKDSESYASKIRRMERKLNKEFESMEIANSERDKDKDAQMSWKRKEEGMHSDIDAGYGDCEYY